MEMLWDGAANPSSSIASFTGRFPPSATHCIIPMDEMHTTRNNSINSPCIVEFRESGERRSTETLIDGPERAMDSER